MEQPRNLTLDEINDILEALDPGNLFNDIIKQNVMHAHRYNIKKQLENGLIKPSKIGALKERIIKQYYRALLKPGDHYALSSAQAVVQPIYQASLNAFHSAGSLIKTSDIIKLVNVIINANKTIPFAFSTINVNRLFTDSDLYFILRRDLLEVKFKDIQYATTIFNSGEGSEMITEHSKYYELIDWYDSIDVSPDDYLLHIKLDKTLMYIKYLTPFSIAKSLMLFLGQNSVYIFPSPATIDEPFIDIILPHHQAQSVSTQISRYSTNIGDDNLVVHKLGSTFFKNVLMPQISDLTISGVRGVHEVSVQKISFSGTITEYTKLKENTFRVKFRRYHISNRIMTTESMIKIYALDWERVSDSEMEDQGYDVYDITIPHTEDNPVSYFDKKSYVYGIVKTYRRDKNELVSIDFSDLMVYDYIDPYLCNSTNFYHIRDMLGINACNNNIVNSLTNIIAEQSAATYPEHSVLIANYICVLGDLFPYTFSGYSQHNIGPLASAAFQDPLRSTIAYSLGSEQPISSVDAAITSGTRPEIGRNYPIYRQLKTGRQVDFNKVVEELTARPNKEPQKHPEIQEPKKEEKAGPSESVISVEKTVGRIKPRGSRPPITNRTPSKPTALNSVSGKSVYIPIQTAQTNITEIVVSEYILMLSQQRYFDIKSVNYNSMFSFWAR